MADLWIRDIAGNKALIDDADRDTWTVRGWSPALAPVDGEFVWMAHPDVEKPALQPWASRHYFQAVDWAPAPPEEPVDPTRDPVLTGADQTPPDGPVTTVTEWVGDDRRKAEAALAAELKRDKPRTTLVDALGQVGQPQDDTAAPAAPSKEE